MQVPPVGYSTTKATLQSRASTQNRQRRGVHKANLVGGGVGVGGGTNIVELLKERRAETVFDPGQESLKMISVSQVLDYKPK